MNDRLIATLCDLVPLRPLAAVEAYRLAVLQADRLLKHLEVDEPPVDLTSLTELSKVRVRYVAHWPTSGMTRWTHASWSVVINASEPRVRQRFSLAHEFKHILDDRFADIIYPKGTTMGQTYQRELVCDYFGGCLLVPKRWLRKAWTEGLQTPFLLARRFDVSTAAIDVRLSQLGLTEAVNRHGIRRSYFRLDAVPASLSDTAA
jgi:Zn-dependent peptidase ImmA (M78 family)